MAIEIERRFLLKNESWKRDVPGRKYRQGYLYFRDDGVLRIRIAGEKGFLTVKMPKDDVSALEYEYEIPLHDAADMLGQLCTGNPVEKTRYEIPYAGMLWEVDEFLGDNEGLVIAEVELESEDQRIDVPPWAGREITGRKKYLNASLYLNPYKNWPPEER